MNDRRGAKGVDISHAQALLKKTNAIVAARDALAAELGKPVAAGEKLGELEQELIGAIDETEISSEAMHLRGLIEDWAKELEDAGVSESEPDREAVLSAAKEVCGGMRIAVGPDEDSD